MASPSDPTDSSRDQVTEPETLPPNSNPTEKPTVEQGNETLNLKSTQRDLEEPDAIDQQPDPSIGESKNEEDDTDATQAVSSSIYRRVGGGGKKKKGFLKKRKQQEKSREKLEVLLKTLKPIPFVPKKALDFARHEKLLKTLGIWEFLHLEFDQNIRQDLVANLVAYYTTEGRCSYVNGVRVNVTRADLARALKLPKKKDIVITDEEREVLETDESAKFVNEILETWVLLHTEDMWVMPVEVVEWGKDVKEKQLEKLDWAALLWFMVEKELKADPPLGDCFFASHLQLLIRNQKEDLLREESKVDDEEEDDVKEVEFMVKSSKEDLLKEESKVGAEDDDDDVKEVEFMVKSPKEDCSEVKEEEKDVVAADSGRDDCATESKEQETYVEEHMIELNLRQETVSEMVAVEQQQQGPVEEQPTNVEEQPMDVEENKKEEDEKWPWNGETHVGTSHFLRHCDLSISRHGDEENNIEGHMEMGEDDEQIEDLEEEDEDTEKHEEGFPFFPNGDSLHGVGQENLILGDASPLRYASGLQMHGNSSDGHFLASMALAASGSNTNNKRQIDHENDMSYHHNPPESKRLRTDEPSWDEKPPPVEVCVEQIMMWAEKARMSCAQKDREGAQSEMNQEYLMSEVQRKDETIHDLKRSMYEEQQRKDLMIYRLETELRMMTSVLEGYRKALKATKKASAEHRKRCPLRDEKPVYKDVKGSGGLVLSVAEVEKLRLKQEEEDRVTRARIERQIEEFGSDCVRVFEEQIDAVELLNERLIEVENEVKICRETLSESKKDETCEVATAAAAAAAEVATAAATEET